MKRRILPIGILPILPFTIISMMFGTNTLLAQSSVTVTVTNVSFDVNGDTTNIDALLNDPGPDGISLPEAIYATDGTQGQKLINFDKSLKGATITYSTEQDVMELSSSNITIDGDIDGDGMPDVTLDGHLAQDGPACNGLVITSSSNTITHLNFNEFIYAIIITTPRNFARKTFTNNTIINNTISSQRGAGIWISPAGMGSMEELPKLSDIIWQGIVIQGNRIVTNKNNAFRVGAAEVGGDRNQVLNLIIDDNYLSSQELAALDVIVADASSDYFGIPGPIEYSDHNLIDSLTITNNVIENSWLGMHIICANYGNSQNRLQNVKIADNTITSTGISLIAGEGSDKEKASENNLIENVEITRNTIRRIGGNGISIGGGGQAFGFGANNNRVENVLIANNEIYDCDAGVCLLGGYSNSHNVNDNLLDHITISENNIYQTVNQGNGAGIQIQGASTHSNGSSMNNIVQGIHILNNLVSKNGIGIQVFGGDGTGAENNQVILEEVQGDTLVDNIVAWIIRDNTNGAVKNLVTGTVTTPTFSPPPDTYTTAIDVSIACEITGITIRFTTDNSNPTESSTIYTSPIRINTTTTIKARAYLNNWSPSEVATASYTFPNRSPVVSNTMADTILIVGGADLTRDLNTAPAVFSDPDGDELSYTASSSTLSIANASISGSILTVSPLSEGMVTIKVTADDGIGGMTSTDFEVEVYQNHSPIVSNTVADTILIVGGADLTRDLNSTPAIFSDPDGDELSYTTSSSTPSIANASISGSILTVSPLSEGMVTIKVTADDGKGGMTSTDFEVEVYQNHSPIVSNTILDTILIVGGADLTRDLNSTPAIFSDPDGDELTYTASSSDSSIVKASISGSILTVSPISEGTATVTVTADDNKGRTASTDFEINAGTLNPPENLRASTQNSSVTLTWDSPSSTSIFILEHYCIYCSRQPDPRNNAQQKDTTNVNTTSFTYENLTNEDEWYYTVTAIYNGGRESPPCSEITVVVDVETVTSRVPSAFALMQNYPNPFNPTTKIRYEIPDEGLVVLTVYDVLGNKIAELVNERKLPGRYDAVFNSNNFSSGVYMYKLQVNDFVNIKKMILMR